MEKNKTLKISESTHIHLVDLRKKRGLNTFDEVIKSLLNFPDKDSKFLIENNIKIINRQEQFFKRLGALEKLYLKPILLHFDSEKIEENGENKLKENVINNEEEEKYKKEIKKLIFENSELLKTNQYNESQLNHLDSLVDKKQNIINSLQKKIVKSSGVFSSGYEMKLSETEYKEIFE